MTSMPTTLFYDTSELVPRVRGFLARNLEARFSEEELASKLRISIHEAHAVLEALAVEGEVLP